MAEVSYCESAGFTTHWGKHIPPNKVSAHDLYPDQRPRLGSAHEDRWFHYDSAQPASYPEAAAAADAQGPPAQFGAFALLDGGVETIHVHMDDAAHVSLHAG